jgi:alkylation response protein AidB-like acyl-CoA dehydrogenase
MGMAHDVGLQQRELEELVEFTRQTSHGGELLIRNPVYRRQLAERAVEIEIARCLCYRLAWLLEKGEDVNTTAYASMLKAFNSETGQRLAYTGSEIMGLYGQVKEGSGWAPLNGTYEYLYQIRVGLNIAGGTSEIQRNLIAWTALNLPRV